MKDHRFSLANFAPYLRYAVFSVAMMPVLVHAAPIYKVTVLAESEESEFRALGINNAGQVVGYTSANNNGNVQDAVLYKNGTVTVLNNLGGDYNGGVAINASGQIVGYVSDIAGNSFTSRGFLYQNGAVTVFGTTYSSASDINDAGQVVGGVDSANDTTHAFLYDNGVMTDLGTLAGGTNSYANAINDAGQIVGSSDSASDHHSHAIVYQNGVMSDLNSFGSNLTSASDINNAGQIIGQASTNAGWEGFLYQNGIVTYIGKLDGGTYANAYGINDLGQVVGVSNTAKSYFDWNAFLYQDGKTTNLNDLIDPASGWRLTDAYAINNKGQISASGCRVGTGICGALRLDSIDSAAVPEPGSGSILLSGILAMAYAGRRARRR